MSEDGGKLLEALMGSLGDNPAEKIGQMLSALTEKTEEQTENPVEETREQEEESAFSLPGGFDIETLMKIQRVMSLMNQNEHDERDRLLSALKPFLSEERRPQIDQAIKFLKLSQLAKTAQEMDLFGKLL